MKSIRETNEWRKERIEHPSFSAAIIDKIYRDHQKKKAKK